MKKTSFLLAVMFFYCNVYSQWSPTSLNYYTILSFAENNNILYAGTYNHGIYISVDSANTWIHAMDNSLFVRCFAFSGNNVFAGGYDDLNYFGGVYLSTNNGNNWTQTSLVNKLVTTLIIKGNNLLAGTNGQGVFVSTNFGVNWVQTELKYNFLRSMVINGNNIYAGTADSGIYVSENNGLNWSHTTFSQSVLSIATKENLFYASTWSDGLFKSTDYGQNWTQLNLNSYYTIWTLLIVGDTLMVGSDEGTGYCGFRYTTNFGTTWISVCYGVPSYFSYTISKLLKFKNYLYAGTVFGGIWRWNLSMALKSEKISFGIPDKYILLQNCPNPFNPNSVIKFKIKDSRYVTLKVYDVTGKEVAELVNSKLQPGEYEATFDGSGLASGVYYYRLTAGDFSETKKMILIK